MTEKNKIKNHKLIDKPNFMAEAGGLVTNYYFWSISVNKKEIPWEEGRISKNFKENKR